MMIMIGDVKEFLRALDGDTSGILGAFDWEETREGVPYWNTVYHLPTMPLDAAIRLDQMQSIFEQCVHIVEGYFPDEIIRRAMPFEGHSCVTAVPRGVRFSNLHSATLFKLEYGEYDGKVV